MALPSPPGGACPRRIAEVLAQLGAQCCRDHPAGELREQAAPPGDLLRARPLTASSSSSRDNSFSIQMTSASFDALKPSSTTSLLSGWSTSAWKTRIVDVERGQRGALPRARE